MRLREDSLFACLRMVGCMTLTGRWNNSVGIGTNDSAKGHGAYRYFVPVARWRFLDVTPEAARPHLTSRVARDFVLLQPKRTSGAFHLVAVFVATTMWRAADSLSCDITHRRLKWVTVSMRILITSYIRSRTCKKIWTHEPIERKLPRQRIIIQ
jgi:hypothetical protein